MNESVGVRAASGGGPSSRTPSIVPSDSQSLEKSARTAVVQHAEDDAETLATRSLVRQAGPVRQRGEILDCGGGADDPLVVLRAGLQTLGNRLGCRLELGHIQVLDPLSPAEEDPYVGAVEFISRTGEEVAAPFPDVDELMGA